MALVDTIERTLSHGGYRLTMPRRIVLESMRQQGNHFTAENVQLSAPEVGRATVFRTMKLMRDLGIICQVVLDDGATVYQLTEDDAGEHHHHVICSGCGEVAEFSSDGLEDGLADIARRTGFEIDTHRLELYGRCGRCRRA
jgi:Fur family ferric uptake transcriptional regulator